MRKPNPTTYFLFFLYMLGCGSANNNSDHSSTPKASIPFSSPFSKIQEGMSQKQVRDIIGSPTDYSIYPTGKNRIPFYHGKDIMRTDWLYKENGIITFAGGIGHSTVYRIIYDPSEDGYANKKD